VLYRRWAIGTGKMMLSWGLAVDPGVHRAAYALSDTSSSRCIVGGISAGMVT
jgi:hypothetical protein